MSEEVAVKIAETLASIKDAIWLIAGMAICLIVFFGIAILVYLTKD